MKSFKKFLKNKKTLILIILVLVFLAVGIKVVIFPSSLSKNSEYSQTNSLVKDQAKAETNTEPSETLKNYSDPSGFSFNYPDNLSLLPNALKDSNSYADLQLVSKDAEGSLRLNITDTKLKTIDDWVKKTGSTDVPKDVNLGNLKAKEVVSGDKVMLASLDSGILFNIEVAKNDYFLKVYEKVLKGFSFTQPAQASTSEGTAVSAEDVSFEGEEVVE